MTAVDAPAVVVHYRLHADFAVGSPLVRRILGPRAGLELDADGLRVRFGPWLVETPLSNLAGAEATGPYRAVRVFGVRLSLADRGLTFGTTTRGGVCLRFREPVRGIDPWGLLRHPGLTVTVSEPALVAEAINRIVGAA
ncbi:MULTISPECIES: hypothetical protein [unclassified Amycolatopsis]|uniref:hypothetical protein n=1 Tax=unclassified Amycolatopsis TaxID=2618356 RepID=UPI00287493CE|nr:MULTISPECIES: hypothetical protein [unclassified Amycolatopsis]MDS0138987.1 hypothetical protein [Amycolatopsis sp. 505]MDS0147659.1 hypothetical protein [Amycolatopsis sp. CM201R]